jgi:hypothetical protein
MKRLFAATGLSLIILTGCNALYHATRPDPPQLTAFLPQHKLLVEQQPEFPFYYFWEKKNIDWSKYNSVYVAPVNTDYLLKDNWWEKVNTQTLDKVKKEIPELAKYMREKFVDELSSVQARGNFKMVDKPGSGTITVELALTKLVPTKAELNLLGTGASIFIPGAGLAASMASGGSVSVECKAVDSQTGDLLLMFADREDDPSAAINIAGFTWYSAAKSNIDMWARQTAAMAVVSKLEEMKRDFPFQLINY